MDDPALLALLESVEADGRASVRSPGVGWWSAHPRAGSVLGAGAPAGTLTRLNQQFILLLPEGVAGVVEGPLPADRSVAVAYGEVLFRLAAIERGTLPVAAVSAGLTREGSGLTAGTHAIVAPTDGTFYRRPGAGAPPFVEPGSRVRVGQPLGLVEVMKTFNQVLYGGAGLPEEAEILEVRCADADEVRAGQVLFVVR